jgi:hypothetical protein
MGKIRDCFELHKIKLHEQISRGFIKINANDRLPQCGGACRLVRVVDVVEG